jgi:arylsulfatase
LPEDIASYRDRYLKGWDAVREERWQRLRAMGIVNCKPAPLDSPLTPRYFHEKFMTNLGPGEVNHAMPWRELTQEQKEFQATKMAIHAAMVDRMDREIGRVLDQLRTMNALENTVIFFLSDNGADATLLIRGDGHDPLAPPGSAGSFLCIGPGWASASNAPFRRHKIWVNEGGISTPLIVHWPAGIRAKGKLRHDIGHVIDFVPTVLELTGAHASSTWHGVEVPPLPGRSLVPAFRKDGSVKRDFLYFNHEGNRALLMGKWKLVSAREDSDRWELFDLNRDRCEAVDLAAKQPKRVEQMEAKWKQFDEQLQALARSPEP